MKKKNELSYRDLKMTCDTNLFHFETTEELEPTSTGIGQDRGIKALEFGINVDVKGYNIYIEGPSGLGKTMYTKNYLDTISTKKKIPCDWCYVYNFDNPNEPIAISLPAGQGKEFKNSMDGFIKEIKNETGFCASVLNLGGGYGVRYIDSDEYLNIEKTISEVASHIKEKCASLDMDMPRILMEPGRSIVADAGITLYTVGSVKTIAGYKSYVSIDGGMGDNPRYALYGSRYSALVANKANENADFLCTIAGKCCESGDLIAENIMLQKPERGDILAVLVTGAYNYSMSSNYNRIPRPPVVILKDGKSRVAVKRETYADVMRNDV